MKIRRVRATRVRMPLARPYAISYQVVREAVNVFVRIDTSDGRTGWGCAAPDADVTGESPARSLAALSGRLAEFLEGQDPERIAWLEAECLRLVPDAPAAVTAVSSALHDLLGKRAGMPLFRLLGYFRPRILTSVTIGICDVDETVREARAARRQGFQVVKIKGGQDRRKDAARVEAVLSGIPDLRIRFDANQGYSVPDARAFIRRFGRKIEIFEQPVRAGNLFALKRVSALSPAPVMADESLLSLRDSFRIAARGMADMVNIKLMKIGGIRMAVKANAVAEAGGMETMVGCMDESRLGISAGLHFALAHRNVEYADLDGHLDLLDDPARGGPRISNGWMSAPERPGLGVEVDL